MKKENCHTFGLTKTTNNKQTFRGYCVICDWDLLWYCRASLSPTLPSLKCLSVSQNWRPRIVVKSVKFPPWIEFPENYSYFPGQISYTSILSSILKLRKFYIDTRPQLLFGVRTGFFGLYLFERHKKSFKNFLVLRYEDCKRSKRSTFYHSQWKSILNTEQYWIKRKG